MYQKVIKSIDDSTPYYIPLNFWRDFLMLNLVFSPLSSSVKKA